MNIFFTVPAGTTKAIAQDEDMAWASDEDCDSCAEVSVRESQGDIAVSIITAWSGFKYVLTNLLITEDEELAYYEGAEKGFLAQKLLPNIAAKFLVVRGSYGDYETLDDYARRKGEYIKVMEKKLEDGAFDGLGPNGFGLTWQNIHLVAATLYPILMGDPLRMDMKYDSYVEMIDFIFKEEAA